MVTVVVVELAEQIGDGSDIKRQHPAVGCMARFGVRGTSYCLFLYVWFLLV